MQKRFLDNSGIIFLVIAYKTWRESKTLKSIITEITNIDEVYIWVNDGTTCINKKKILFVCGKKINVIKSSSNTPLPNIYNSFINKFRYDKRPLLILDDDSEVSIEYLRDVRCKMIKKLYKNKAVIPLAISGKDIISPIQSTVIRKHWDKKIPRPPNIIASGLCLGRNLRNSIKFDKSFYFYGADTMYGYNIFNSNTYDISVSNHKISHTPSTNNGGISEFKYKSIISSQFILFKKTLIFKHLYLLTLMSIKYCIHTANNSWKKLRGYLFKTLKII